MLYLISFHCIAVCNFFPFLTHCFQLLFSVINIKAQLRFYRPRSFCEILSHFYLLKSRWWWWWWKCFWRGKITGFFSHALELWIIFTFTIWMNLIFTALWHAWEAHQKCESCKYVHGIIVGWWWWTRSSLTVIAKGIFN